MALTTIDVPSLEKLSTGKVRDIFALPDPSTLLFVASDRISAYDVILANGIPNRGAILTLASAHWFRLLPSLLPGLRTHFLSLDVPATVPAAAAPSLRHRSMQVRKLRILPVEAIVRGYLAGSGWKEYQRAGTVHGIALPEGLRECERLPTGPLFTPSTKAPQGEHDENIHPDEVAALIGEKYAARVRELALSIYQAAADYALERGIIIADTKFEFAVDDATDEVVLADEVLTPDSSRFWDAATYEAGRDQDSFDKQIVRNWLVANGVKGKEGVVLPEDVCNATEARYKDVF
ncbi:unnamed protein product [Parascedosporium putredinis]|uniref:Phosphoribosylaminoimidazole-succinocarboxamide synthase n=1 Tax=Parascedosporium putredinis TaxID=1442378 RepID=A0A9P1M7E2_9PEZI|nr:unnamed protein product [Parascedosporium putredinis]CAI7988091.1 unnamed protein product [Parascedosporium putredinis]